MHGLRRIALIGIAALSAACLAAPASARLADPGATRTMDLRGAADPRVAAPETPFDFSVHQVAPLRHPFVLDVRAREFVDAGDDAMPVGRLRSFSSRFAPWRGTPWMSAQPMRDDDPND